MNLFRYRKKSTTKCREIHFIKAETGQQSPRQRPDGDRRSDDGKPRDSVSDTVGNMAAGGLAKRFTVGQQVLRNVSFEDGSISGTLTFKQPLEVGSDGKLTKWSTATLEFKRGILVSGTWSNG